MPISLVLESLDNVEESLKPHYKQDADNKFYLDTDDTIKVHKDVLSLRNAYDRVKTDLEAVKTERDQLKANSANLPEDFDLEIWKKAKDGKADEAALIKMRAELEADRDSWKNKAGEAEGKLSRFAVERDLGDALLAAGINDPGLSEGARAILAPKVKTGDDGKAIVESDMGPVSVDDYVKRWAASGGKKYVTLPSGGGRKGGDGSGNSNKKWSEMTSGEKVALNRDNPEEYQRIKAAG
jgi:hypothetical protein